MKGILLLLLVVLLTSCAARMPTQPGSPTSPALIMNAASSTTMASVGEEALQQVNGWYGRTDQNCGNAKRAAFLCSGVMLRATETNPAFLPWDPSPGSIASGGVAFSWLRTDTNFAKLAYGYANGYIFYPVLDTPAGKNSSIGVLCAFSMDADTNNRPTEQGCGPNTRTPVSSRSCKIQGIVTAAQWITHFNALSNKYEGQCGWNTRDSVANSADQFYQAIAARKLMPAIWWDVQNEMRLATWQTGTGATLPIRAFFYIAKNKAALADAQNDQARFRAAYGMDIPILQLTLPATLAGKASFAYRADDQGSVPPPDAGTVHFEDVPLQGPIDTLDLADISITATRETMFISNLAAARPYVSGHHLAIRNVTGSLLSVLITPNHPSHEISFGYSLDPGAVIQGIADCTDGSRISFDSASGVQDGILSVKAPSGQLIENIVFYPWDGRPSTYLIDNIAVK